MSDTHRSGRSLIGIAWAGLARAPRRSQLALAANILLLVAVTATVLMDIEAGEEAALRIIGLVLIMGGALLLSVASVLWALSQERGCGFFEFKRKALSLRGYRTRKLDEALIAFPVFAFIAGCLMAAGFALSASALGRPVSRLIILGMGVWFFLWTAFMIASTTRFMYSHAREQADAAARARGEATESQLAALQAQMNPHFLFNTLNTVASLVRTDRAAAEATVENLAVVLRRTLDRSRRVLSRVDDEVDHLAAYISVAKQRFEDRLHVHWAVDPRAHDVLLPTMTLQPLVENALKHGLGARMEGGALHIGVQLEAAPDDRSAAPAIDARAGNEPQLEAQPAGGGTRLVLEVADDGPGFPRKHVEGTGLSNLRARLRTLYGDEAELIIDRGAPGSRVVVSMPALHSAEEALGLTESGLSTEVVAPVTTGKPS